MEIIANHTCWLFSRYGRGVGWHNRKCLTTQHSARLRGGGRSVGRARSGKPSAGGRSTCRAIWSRVLAGTVLWTTRQRAESQSTTANERRAYMSYKMSLQYDAGGSHSISRVIRSCPRLCKLRSGECVNGRGAVLAARAGILDRTPHGSPRWNLGQPDSSATPNLTWLGPQRNLEKYRFAALELSRVANLNLRQPPQSRTSTF